MWHKFPFTYGACYTEMPVRCVLDTSQMYWFSFFHPVDLLHLQAFSFARNFCFLFRSETDPYWFFVYGLCSHMWFFQSTFHGSHIFRPLSITTCVAVQLPVQPVCSDAPSLQLNRRARCAAASCGASFEPSPRAAGHKAISSCAAICDGLTTSILRMAVPQVVPGSPTLKPWLAVPHALHQCSACQMRWW